MNQRLVSAGLMGATAIALGAYAAHGLEGSLAGLGYQGEELAHRIDNFVTASQYQLHAATALLALGLVPIGRSPLRWTFNGLLLGAILFSGLLYMLAFAGDGWRWLGAIVPLGGLAMIGAWTAVAWAGLTERNHQSDDENLHLKEPDEEPTSRDELVRVEELLSYQQHLLNELDGVVTEVRGQSDALQAKLVTIEQTTRRLTDFQQGAESDPDERPPHY